MEFGLSEAHVVAADPTAPGLKLQPAMWPGWRRLQALAAGEGIALEAVSGFRSFGRQLVIWNEKALGVRPLLADDGRPLDTMALAPRDRLYAILRWSALPGMSRHHWGTEVDVIDRAAMYRGYKVQLTVAETRPDGIFARLHQWLDHILTTAVGREFGRPYRRDSGGVAPEPWHLSYLPLAERYVHQLDEETAREFIRQQHDVLELADLVLADFEEIYHRFIAPPA